LVNADKFDPGPKDHATTSTEKRVDELYPVCTQAVGLHGNE